MRHTSKEHKNDIFFKPNHGYLLQNHIQTVAPQPQWEMLYWHYDTLLAWVCNQSDALLICLQ